METGSLWSRASHQGKARGGADIARGAANQDLKLTRLSHPAFLRRVVVRKLFFGQREGQGFYLTGSQGHLLKAF